MVERVARVFVYGTLKRRGRLNAYLGAGARFVGEARVYGLTLMDAGFNFPFAVPDPGGCTHGEVFEIAVETLRHLDLIEAGYTRESWPVFSGDREPIRGGKPYPVDTAQVYVYRGAPPSGAWTPVPGGKW